MSDRSALRGPAGPTGWHLAGLGAAVALAYVLAAQVGFRFAFVAEQVTRIRSPDIARSSSTITTTAASSLPQC